MDLDPVAVQHLAERIAERRRLAGQDVRAALDDRDLAAEAAHGLRQLDADRPAAEHEQPPRHGLHAGRLAVRPDAVELAQPRHGRHERVGAVRQDDVLRGVTAAVDLDGAGARQRAAPPDQVDPVLGEPALLPGVGVVRDHEVAPRERCLDVDRRRRGGVVRGVRRLAGPQERLRRDAGPVRALAADQLALDERHAKTAFGERPGAVLTGRAAADHDHVVVAHSGSSFPACSAAMYAAYQSGQFSSNSPPWRFSCSPWAAAARRSA